MPDRTTLDQLATMIQRGFEAAATKTELENLRTETRDGFRVVADDLKLLHDGLRDINITLGGLVRTVTVLEGSVRALDKRVTRLEEKAGLLH